MTKTSIKSPRKLGFKTLIIILLILSFGLFTASGYYYYRNVATNPDRVLSAVLDKSLQTTSIQRTVEQQDQQTQQTQKTHIQFSPNTVALSEATIKQKTQNGDTKVVTETIGTKTSDFVRYKSIDVQQSQNNFKEVLNVWSERKGDQATGQGLSFLNGELFGIIPFGNLNPQQREVVIDKINAEKPYQISSTKTEFQSGRPVITYNLAVDLQKLIKVLALYSDITGIKNPALDPSQYEGQPKLQVTMSVDIISKHINVIDLASSGRKEVYSAYNLDKEIPLPTKTISTEELQKRLQKLEPATN